MDQLLFEHKYHPNHQLILEYLYQIIIVELLIKLECTNQFLVTIYYLKYLHTIITTDIFHLMF